MHEDSKDDIINVHSGGMSDAAQRKTKLVVMGR